MKTKKSSMIFIFCDYDELLSCNVHLLFLSLSCFKDFTVNIVNLETNRQFYLFVSWLDLSCVLLNKRLKKRIFKDLFYRGGWYCSSLCDNERVPHYQHTTAHNSLFVAKQVLMYQVVPRINCINELIVLTN